MPNPDEDTVRRLDRLEEGLECLTQLQANGTNIGRLRRSIGDLAAASNRLVDLGAWVRTSQGASSDARDRRSRHDHLLFGRETGGRVESKAAKERP